MPEAPNLGELIDAQIRANGPISVAEYMRLCLAHPRHGYYSAGEPIGRGGDFVTAPEISQMFGELIGFFFVNLWQQMREPPSFTLLELGPGRGVLMEDLLRAASRAPGFRDALHLQLFESNADLRQIQQAGLSAFEPYWPDEIDAVSDDPLFVVANEFFDALPIRQFIKAETGWHERLIGLRDGQRTFGLSPAPFDELADLHPEAETGEVLELRPAATDIMLRLARKVARQGGGILVIDYGYEGHSASNTLQAVRDHAYADPLDAPGNTDISAHVDFAPLRQAAAAVGLMAQPLRTQGAFLRALGIGDRAAALSSANPGQAASIAAAHDRLTAPGQMGELFKVFCAASPGLKPAGFE